MRKGKRQGGKVGRLVLKKREKTIEVMTENKRKQKTRSEADQKYKKMREE